MVTAEMHKICVFSSVLEIEKCAADIKCFACASMNEKRVHGFWKMWPLNAFCVSLDH